MGTAHRSEPNALMPRSHYTNQFNFRSQRVRERIPESGRKIYNFTKYRN
jgi:hypothetical protein